MKLAVVINVGYGPVPLKRAIGAQTLLLDRLGARLDSIRLAAPRLLCQACASAIAEKPDVLIVAGGPRTVRRAGELAHQHGITVLFLAGFGSTERAGQLCGSLALEDMISALAREEWRPVRVGLGMAGERAFFQQASCGLSPHLPELRAALEEADTFAEGWRVLARAAQLVHFLTSPNVDFGFGNGSVRRASALIIKRAEVNKQIESWREQTPQVLRCSATNYGPLGLFSALISSSAGGGWGRGRIDHFESPTFWVEAGRPSWFLLDGDPVRFEGRVEFRFIPAALQTLAFNPAGRLATDNHQNVARFRSSNRAEESQWNFQPPSHVSLPESRESDYRRH